MSRSAEPQPGQLRDAHPGRVERLQDRPVAERARVVADDRREQELHLGFGERLRDGLGDPRRRDALGRVECRPALVDAEAVQATHRRQCPRRRGGPACLAQERHVRLDRADVRLQQRHAALGEETLVGKEVSPIGRDRGRRPPALHAQVREELLGIPAEHGLGGQRLPLSRADAGPNAARRGKSAPAATPRSSSRRRSRRWR